MFTMRYNDHLQKKRIALHLAVENNRADLVAGLLSDEQVAEMINYTDPNGFSPLHKAFSAGFTDIVQLLSAAGARSPFLAVNTRKRSLNDADLISDKKQKVNF